MKKQRNSILILSFLMILMILMYIFFIFQSKQSSEAFAKAGTLNLKSWDFEKHEIVQLNGQWNFYPSMLKSDINADTPSINKIVPDYWEEDSNLKFSPHGFGTYKLKITGLKPNSIYGVDLPDQVTSYSLYANNKKIAKNGTVSKEGGTYIPNWHPMTNALQTDENGEVTLVMEIANFKYTRGGFWNSIKFGELNAILTNADKEKSKEMFLFSTILIMGCFSLGLFLVYKKEKTALYFAFFCFCMAITTFLTGRRLVSDLIPISNWNLLVRIEFLSGYLLLPIFGLFLLNLFDVKSHLLIKKRFFQLFILCCTLITMLAPIKIYSSFIEPYKYTSIIFALYFAYLICIEIKKKQVGSILILFAVLGLLSAIYQETFIRGPVSWLPFASLNFVICFLLITFQRFLNIVKENDILETKVILDPLTKLYNRNFLMKLDKNYFQVHRNTFLVFLDLDNFKQINDTYGHVIGDFILQETSRRLKIVFNPTDIICRFGGDEFVIIATTNEPQDIIEIAKSIIESIELPFEKDFTKYHVGVSVGITKSNDKQNSIQTLIKSSDEAMYIAKNKGGNQYFIIN